MKKYISLLILFIIFLFNIGSLNAYNSEYFLIKEYDEKNNKAIVYSYLAKKSYLLDLEYTHITYRNKNINGKIILINKGNDFNIDKYDQFILDKKVSVNIMKIETIDNSFTLNSCKNDYNFYKYNCVEIKPIVIIKSSPYPYNYNPIINKGKTIDTNQIEKKFQIIKNKYNHSTDTSKYRGYSSLLRNLEKKQTKSLITLDTIEYLIYLVGNELQYINNKYCDNISEMLGICKLKN